MDLKSCCDTICAISTPRGNGGVSIIRLSGSSALEISATVASPTPAPPRHAHVVTVKIDNITDTALLLYFPAPASFTGENVVELQLHGGQYFTDLVLDTLLKNGARLAENGEFTRRALMNGKINLTDAEKLINIIHAESRAELNAATNPDTTKKLLAIEHGLIEISAQIEAHLDHPDDVPPPKIAPAVKKIISALTEFTQNQKNANYIYNGINVAILGEPNAGKSTLFNALLGHDRAIVTDMAGTTTDTISETIEISGFRVRLTDTAGLREIPATPANATSNTRSASHAPHASHANIERQGISRTQKIATQCDLAIIFDDTPLPLIGSKPYIKVTRSGNTPPPKFSPTPAQIRTEIIKKTIGDPNFSTRAIATPRQIAALNLALTALKSAQTATQPDLIASDLQTALFHLGTITGTNATESTLDEIFSRFCLGK